MNSRLLISPNRAPRGFSLAEILVVMGIIVVLMLILIPVVGKVRTSAKAADSANMISVLTTAIQNYHNDHRSYPGPLHNNDIEQGTSAIPGGGVTANGGGNTTNQITMAENLVLGLLGGLVLNNTDQVTFDYQAVGQGPRGLGATPKKFTPYIDGVNLSWNRPGHSPSVTSGAYVDDAGAAADSNIPEFLDRFTGPMPILYLRARVGAQGVIATGAQVAQYHIDQYSGYTDSTIGEGKNPEEGEYTSSPNPPFLHGLRTVTLTAVLSPKTSANYAYPYDAFPYFKHPSLSTTAIPVPRQKDGYILISAGKDRMYGTKDDITNFGSVLP